MSARFDEHTAFPGVALLTIGAALIGLGHLIRPRRSCP